MTGCPAVLKGAFSSGLYLLSLRTTPSFAVALYNPSAAFAEKGINRKNIIRAGLTIVRYTVMFMPHPLLKT
jgi:hypothetical protein